MTEAKFMTSEPSLAVRRPEPPSVKDEETLKVLSWHLLKGGLKVPKLEGVTDIDQIIQAGFQQINSYYDTVQKNIIDVLQGNKADNTLKLAPNAAPPK
jgi:hypothetical protein